MLYVPSYNSIEANSKNIYDYPEIFISAKTHAKQNTLKQKAGEIYRRPSYSVSSI